jgi:enoyl-[acyl-carrier-protein] reductase (NADH)
LRIPSGFPHSHGLDDWNEAITGETIHVDCGARLV